MEGEFEQNIENALNAVRGQLAAHGGGVTLVSADAATGVVSVRFSGACAGCPFASLTLEGIIDEELRRVDGVTEVVAADDTNIAP